MISERVRTASVLARPGTPSRRMCPPVSMPTRSRSTIMSWPTIRRETSFTTRWSRATSTVSAARVPSAISSSGSSVLGRLEVDRAVERALLGRRERAVAAGGEITQPHRPVRKTCEAVHLATHRLAPAANDAVAAFLKREIDDAAAVLARTHPHLLGFHRPPFDDHLLPDRRGDFRRRPPVHERRVAPGNAVARVREAVDRLAV